MLQENLIKMYEQSFREHREMSAVSDYFSGESYSYYGFAKAVAKPHILFDEAGINDDYLEDIRKGDKFTVGGNA